MAPKPIKRRFFGEQQRFALALVAPAALILIFFQLIPIIMGTSASFRDWMLFNPKKTWVGLAQYKAVLTDSGFLTIVLPNTFLFMISSVVISLVIGMMLALAMNRAFIGRKLVQTILLLPLMVAPVIAAIMMRWIFNDQFGIVNVVLEALGGTGQAWLVQRWSAFSVIVLTDVWLWAPWFGLLLLAGLQSLPKEPFEAAEIDGTTAWRTFRYLTLPMLKPVIIVCIVIRAIDAFRTFDTVWALTGGGPARQTELFSLYAYEEAFVFLNFAKGTAAAIVGAIIILVAGLALYRALGHVRRAG
ncbi:MAG: sugar ABC transporter permease [Castellaniella sp.]|uniref:carbohydrate ABC transporter permease n=1 Tax=Castellaniella sp. TaxID=1955812 RepID=UPI0012210BA2|nr:sugar ABC transporter permease [Castellaniella sp.]TAN25880.1 MAG: sugar ABC transporter permease [Castellaniella sp.]